MEAVNVLLLSPLAERGMEFSFATLCLERQMAVLEIGNLF